VFQGGDPWLSGGKDRYQQLSALGWDHFPEPEFGGVGLHRDLGELSRQDSCFTFALVPALIEGIGDNWSAP